MIAPKAFDIIVVGAGHAGIEACLAAARMGCDTLMLTLNLDHIGQMSCNPAIGGIGKGHLVKEIDALGGEMARAIDETGIQFRQLNTRKGPAVRASRAQADKALYRQRMKRVVENCSGLTLQQGSVESLIVEDGAVKGVETQIGERFIGRRVILTTGTFLKGLVHIGDRNFPAGRAGDFAVYGLSESLVHLGFKVGRLKTGTCPRLDGRTIDYSKVEVQQGDERPLPFMRQVLTAQVEPGFRLRAIRYVSAQGDRQALAALQAIMHSATEQPSVRDAPAQAHGAALSGSSPRMRTAGSGSPISRTRCALSPRS